MQCLDDPDNLEIFGNLETAKSRFISVQVAKCLNGGQYNFTHCQKEELIDNAMQYTQFQLFYRRVKFDEKLRGESAVKTVHDAQGFFLSADNSLWYSNMIVREKVSLQDQILSLDNLTLYENDRLMTIERGNSRPFKHE